MGGQHRGSCVGLHTGPGPVLSSPTRDRRRPGPLLATRETFLSHLGWRSLSDRECLLRAASLLCCRLAATAGRAGDLRLLTGWQITFEKRICQFCSVFVIERSLLLSAAPRAVHPTALSCPRFLPWEIFCGTCVQITLCWSCAVTQGHAHPSSYTSRGTLDWYQPWLPQQ